MLPKRERWTKEHIIISLCSFFCFCLFCFVFLLRLTLPRVRSRFYYSYMYYLLSSFVFFFFFFLEGSRAPSSLNVPCPCEKVHRRARRARAARGNDAAPPRGPGSAGPLPYILTATCLASQGCPRVRDRRFTTISRQRETASGTSY